MTVSLINDPSDFIPTATELKGKKWAKWFEGGELIPSLVSECIGVKETARERADRIWGMTSGELSRDESVTETVRREAQEALKNFERVKGVEEPKDERQSR
jgi:hypothetical protein